MALPRPAYILDNLESVPIFHEQYMVRHPTAAYNVSLRAVSSRLFDLLTTLDDAKNKKGFDSPKETDWDRKLLSATDHFLDSLMEHVEDCGGILRSFFPKSEKNKFEKVFKEYKTSVNPYRDHIAKIVNYIKHNQGRLRTISFSWPSDSLLGYYVEGPVSGGGLGPASISHPDELSGFSFNRDIPYHVTQIFAVGSRLAQALYTVDRNIISSKKPKKIISRDSDWLKAIELVAVLPKVVFPDEMSKPVPAVRIKGKGVSIEYPAKAKWVLPPAGAKISVKMEGDGITRSFKMPYLNREAR